MDKKYFEEKMKTAQERFRELTEKRNVAQAQLNELDKELGRLQGDYRTYEQLKREIEIKETGEKKKEKREEKTKESQQEEIKEEEK